MRRGYRNSLVLPGVDLWHGNVKAANLAVGIVQKGYNEMEETQPQRRAEKGKCGGVVHATSNVCCPSCSW